MTVFLLIVLSVANLWIAAVLAVELKSYAQIVREDPEYLLGPSNPQEATQRIRDAADLVIALIGYLLFLYWCVPHPLLYPSHSRHPLCCAVQRFWIYVCWHAVVLPAVGDACEPRAAAQTDVLRAATLDRRSNSSHCPDLAGHYLVRRK